MIPIAKNTQTPLRFEVAFTVPADADAAAIVAQVVEGVNQLEGALRTLAFYPSN